MALSDNKRLYDISTRLAIYVEGVKVQQSRQFNVVLREVSELLRKLLVRTNYKTLDGLSKAQLNKLIVELRESQSKIYSRYTEQLVKQLKEFMAADLEVNRRAWVTAFNETDEEQSEEIVSDEDAIAFLIGASSSPLIGTAAITGANDRVWSQVVNSPIPANGLYLLPFIKTFAVSAQAGVESLIRKAWANRWTVEQTLRELVGDGTSRQGTSSQMDRIGNQSAAFIHTAIAHIASLVAVDVSSALFNRYRWFSVMDSNTTEICRSRNHKTYRVGAGPLPPAHIRCRSHTAPDRNSDFAEETFYIWLARQPAAVQDDVLSNGGAEALRSGKLKAADLPKYEVDRPLTLVEFRKKIKQILSR